MSDYPDATFWEDPPAQVDAAVSMDVARPEQVDHVVITNWQGEVVVECHCGCSPDD